MKKILRSLMITVTLCVGLCAASTAAFAQPIEVIPQDFKEVSMAQLKAHVEKEVQGLIDSGYVGVDAKNYQGKVMAYVFKKGDHLYVIYEGMLNINPNKFIAIFSDKGTIFLKSMLKADRYYLTFEVIPAGASNGTKI